MKVRPSKTPLSPNEPISMHANLPKAIKKTPQKTTILKIILNDHHILGILLSPATLEISSHHQSPAQGGMQLPTDSSTEASPPELEIIVQETPP